MSTPKIYRHDNKKVPIVIPNNAVLSKTCISECCGSSYIDNIENCLDDYQVWGINLAVNDQPTQVKSTELFKIDSIKIGEWWFNLQLRLPQEGDTDEDYEE